MCSYNLSEWLKRQHKKISRDAPYEVVGHSEKELKAAMKRLLSWLEEEYSKDLSVEPGEMECLLEESKRGGEEAGSESELNEEERE